MKAIIIDEKDNVAVVLGQAAKGEQVDCKLGGRTCTVWAKDPVPMYHKIAVREIKQGEPVVKYGEHIGIAAVDIPEGSHVHVHNVQNNREAL